MWIKCHKTVCLRAQTPPQPLWLLGCISFCCCSCKSSSQSWKPRGDFHSWESLSIVHTGREAFPPGRSTQILLPARHAHPSKELVSPCWQQPRGEGRTERDFLNFLAVRGEADGPHLPEKHCRISEKSDFLHSFTHRCFTCINFLTTLFPENEKSSEKTIAARPF